jgi:hypothetical protein
LLPATSAVTFSTCCVIAGATATTINEIITRLINQEEYTEDEITKKNDGDNIEEETRMAEISDLRKKYLEVYQKYLNAVKRKATKDELLLIINELMEIRTT